MIAASQTSSANLPSGLAFGLVAALIWGAWPVVSRFGLQQTLTPYDITALRVGLAGLLALPVLGEVPSPADLAGIALVTAGMVLALGLHRLGRSA